MAIMIVASCDTRCAVGGLTVADVDPLPDLASLDFLRGRCLSCSGSASDCAATDEDNNNDAVSSSDVMGIFINVAVVSKMILMLTFILVGAVFLHPYPIRSFCSEGGSGLSYQWWQNGHVDGCMIFDSVVYK